MVRRFDAICGSTIGVLVSACCMCYAKVEAQQLQYLLLCGSKRISRQSDLLHGSEVCGKYGTVQRVPARTSFLKSCSDAVHSVISRQ